MIPSCARDCSKMSPEAERKSGCSSVNAACTAGDDSASNAATAKSRNEPSRANAMAARSAPAGRAGRRYRGTRKGSAKETPTTAATGTDSHSNGTSAARLPRMLLRRATAPPVDHAARTSTAVHPDGAPTKNRMEPMTTSTLSGGIQPGLVARGPRATKSCGWAMTRISNPASVARLGDLLTASHSS